MLLNNLFTIKSLILSLIIIIGIWQFGTGTYIYVKAQLAQHLLNTAWNETISGNVNVKPWNWADTYPVAKLIFGKSKNEFIVLAGGTGRTMAFGPGHVTATPLPGNNGNSVIVGHRDTHFKILKTIKLGETINLETPENKLSYTVTKIFIIHQKETQIMQNLGREELTLITCYPFDSYQASGPLRYVIKAQVI